MNHALLHLIFFHLFFINLPVDSKKHPNLNQLFSIRHDHVDSVPRRILKARYALKEKHHLFKRGYLFNSTLSNSTSPLIELTVNSLIPSVDLDSIPGVLSITCFLNFIELRVDEDSDARSMIKNWNPVKTNGILLLINPHWQWYIISMMNPFKTYI